MDFDDPCPEQPASRNDRRDAEQQVPRGGEATEFGAAVVIMSDERELMNARIAASQPEGGTCFPSDQPQPRRSWLQTQSPSSHSTSLETTLIPAA